MSDTAEPAGSWRSAIGHAELTDVGLRRANNQDALAVALAGDEGDWQRRGHVFLVADGMGAHAAGELASKIAAESIPHTYRKLLDRSPHEALRQAVVVANDNIHERGQANAEFQGMGTTCSALVLLPRTAVLAHVGDSRVYRLRNHTLEQLTFDHSLVWEMTATGQMPRGEVASFIPKNIITRSLGPHSDVQIDLEGPFPLRAGDLFLLCSDGLTGQVKDEELGAILSALSPQDAVRVLIDIANLRGGPDNITAVVVQVLAVPAEEPQEPAAPQTTSSTSSSIVQQLLWGVVAVLLVATLALAMAQEMKAALAVGLVAAVALVAALVQAILRLPSPEGIVDGPFGSGPHTVRDCRPNAEGVATLCQMAQQLREAAKDEHWTLDWARFNNHGQQAQAALSAGDFTSAMREYALAISFMMNEIRHQPPRKDRRDRSVLDM